MFGRSLFLVFTAFAATVLAKTQNMNVQYAILTISNEHQLFILETVLNATAPSQLSLLTPVKTKAHAEIVSGKVDLAALAKEVGTVLNSLDKNVAGFKAARAEYAKNNKVDMYSITSYAPEASWDFLYAVFKSAATDLKATKALANLKKLNNEFEEGFASGKPDIKAMTDKIETFKAETQAAASYQFEGLYTITDDHEIDTYTDKLRKIQRGETLPLQTNESSSSGSAADMEEDETPVGSANSTGTGASASETSSPAVTTTPTQTTAADTKTPAPSSGVGATSTTISVAASVIGVMVTYFVL